MFRRRYIMLETRFRVEIEMTGITRKKASETLAGFFWTETEYAGTSYKTYTVKERNSRTWKLMRDGSIRCQLTNERGRRDFSQEPTGTAWKGEPYTYSIQRRSIDNSLLVLIKGVSTAGNLSDKIQVSLLWWYI